MPFNTSLSLIGVQVSPIIVTTTTIKRPITTTIAIITVVGAISRYVFFYLYVNNFLSYHAFPIRGFIRVQINPTAIATITINDPLPPPSPL